MPQIVELPSADCQAVANEAKRLLPLGAVPNRIAIGQFQYCRNQTCPRPSGVALAGITSLDDPGFAVSVVFHFDDRDPITVNVVRDGASLTASVWCGLDDPC